MLRLRAYTPYDCPVLAELFYHTVHTVNLRDYSPEQVCAWADGCVDIARWNASFLSHHTVIAELGGTIVGFGDMDDTGYLDRLYVHCDFQHRGIATAICNALEHAVRAPVLRTHASVTATKAFLSTEATGS